MKREGEADEGTSCPVLFLCCATLAFTPHRLFRFQHPQKPNPPSPPPPPPLFSVSSGSMGCCLRLLTVPLQPCNQNKNRTIQTNEEKKKTTMKVILWCLDTTNECVFYSFTQRCRSTLHPSAKLPTPTPTITLKPIGALPTQINLRDHATHPSSCTPHRKLHSLVNFFRFNNSTTSPGH